MHPIFNSFLVEGSEHVDCSFAFHWFVGPVNFFKRVFSFGLHCVCFFEHVDFHYLFFNVFFFLKWTDETQHGTARQNFPPLFRFLPLHVQMRVSRIYRNAHARDGVCGSEGWCGREGDDVAREIRELIWKRECLEIERGMLL